ncbi:MAG: metallophosphoesterase, partial [Clostridiales bacterium]|nr:metallophosphoesterase [Clostridiales bacterium]
VFDTLLTPLLYEDGALFKEILNKKFDFTSAMTAEEASDLTSILQVAVNIFTLNSGYTYTVDLSAFSISDLFGALKSFISPLIGDMTGFQLPSGDLPLTDLLMSLLKSYLTESFYEGLGGLAGDIVFAFSFDATDDYPYAVEGSPALLLYNAEKDVYTYDGKPHPEYFTPDFIRFGASREITRPSANGQLPSLVTAAHGKDNQTSYSVSFYTAEGVDGRLEYRKLGESAWVSDDSNSLTISAEHKTVGATYTVIDLGLFATYTATEYITLVNGAEVSNPITVYNDDGTLNKEQTLLNAEKADKNSALRINRHTYLLKGLDAGTSYEFRVAGIDLNSGKTFWLNGDKNTSYDAYCYGNAYYGFKTAPAENVPFNVLTIADMQGMLNKSYLDAEKVFDAISASHMLNLKYDFILNAGDNVDNGKNFKQWSYFLNNFGAYAGGTAMYTAAGNHENSGHAISNLFPYSPLLPNDGQSTENGVYYSFQYSNAYFIVLNTNDADGKGLGVKQTEWLRNTLAETERLKASGKIQWVVVMMHKSLYSAGSHSFDAEVEAMRHTLTSLFYDHNVDLVLGGHDHTWSATAFLDRFGNPVANRPADKDSGRLLNPHGVMYVTLGTVGGKFYEYQENPEVAPVFDLSKTITSTLDLPVFGSLSFNGNEMVFYGYQLTENGEIQNLKSTRIWKSADALTSSTDVAAFEYGGQRFAAAEDAVVRVKKAVNPYDFRPILADGNYAYEWTLELKQGGSYRQVTDKSLSFQNGYNYMRFTITAEDGSDTKTVNFSVYRMNDAIFADYTGAKQDFIESLYINKIYAGGGKISFDYFTQKASLFLYYDEETLAEDALGESYNRVELITDGVNAGRYGKLTVRVYAEDGEYFDFIIETERENYVLNTALFSTAGGVLFIAVAVCVFLIVRKRLKQSAAANVGGDAEDDGGKIVETAENETPANAYPTESGAVEAENETPGNAGPTESGAVEAENKTPANAYPTESGATEAENETSGNACPTESDADKNGSDSGVSE